MAFSTCLWERMCSAMTPSCAIVRPSTSAGRPTADSTGLLGAALVDAGDGNDKAGSSARELPWLADGGLESARLLAAAVGDARYDDAPGHRRGTIGDEHQSFSQNTR
jgi:hypothetical protein